MNRRTSEPVPLRALEALRATTRAPVAAKVPEIGLLFWVIKVLTTGTGEAASDYLGTVSLALAGVVGVLGFAAALWLQLRLTRYVAPVYWTAVVMVAIFGTIAADALHVGLALPYAVSTVVYAGLVALMFRLWYRSEGTLSIHSITSRRRETYYWLTVMAAFALGTAAGDLTAISLHLGYFSSAVLFVVVIAVPAIGWWRRINGVLAFWAAYVVTRPLGASLADWLGKPRSDSGRGLGDGTVTAVSLVVIVALVASVTVRRCDVQPGSDAASHRSSRLRPVA